MRAASLAASVERGGDGVDATGAHITNAGTISGGNGGSGSFSPISLQPAIVGGLGTKALADNGKGGGSGGIGIVGSGVTIDNTGWHDRGRVSLRGFLSKTMPSS